MIWRCDGRDKSNAFNRALFGYFFKRELLKSFNSLFSQVWRSTKSFQHFVCDCWFYSFYLFFLSQDQNCFLAPYSLFVFISDSSFGTFVDEGRKNWTDAARGTVASTFNPAAAGAGWWKIQRDRHRERFPLCSVMNVPPTRSLIYIYIVDLVYIYIHCDACACTFTPASSSTLELLISNVIMNHVSLFSFSSQQLRNVFLFSSFGTWFVFSRSSVSSSW